MKRTYIPRKNEIEQEWHIVNLDNKILGRAATEIATLLTGKNKPSYTANINVGDKVVVINAEKVAVTGKKPTNKIYHRYTGYPSGIKSESFQKLLARKPTEVIKKAVWGMLPKNKLRKERIANLYIYQGEEHPHQGQIKQNG